MTSAAIRKAREGSEAAARRRSAELSLDRPQAVDLEVEREGAKLVQSATLFLTGAECPFTCAFCDLWQYTIDGPTPAGSIPRQIEAGLLEVEATARLEGVDGSVLKLYNASNFFDERAVPQNDEAAILALIERARRSGIADRVVVECHPKILASSKGQARLRRYAESCDLEVALGLESVAEGALEVLNKGCNLQDFARAFELVHSTGATTRAFVLYALPLIAGSCPQVESVAWETRPAETVSRSDWEFEQSLQLSKTVAWARAQGARQASVIPVRSGNGTLEKLEHAGAFRRPTLEALCAAFVEAQKLQTPSFDVQLDTWDLDRLDVGELSVEQASHLREKIHRLNLEAGASEFSDPVSDSERLNVVGTPGSPP